MLKQLLGARFPKRGKYPGWARFVIGLFGSHRISAVMNAVMPLVRFGFVVAVLLGVLRVCGYSLALVKRP